MDLENAPRNTITIKGFQFSVPAPFTEGHVLRENEASVLNQTYAENIRNNYASKVEAAKAAAAEAGGEVDLVALQDGLNEYVQTYDFGVRSSSGPREPADPVEKEALNLAKAHVKKALQKEGHKLSDVGAEQITELAKQLLEKHPIIRENAKKIIEAKKAAGAELLGIG